MNLCSLGNVTARLVCSCFFTPTIMKCFERLILRYIKNLLPPILDPLQFVYRTNRSTDDIIITTLHLALFWIKRALTSKCCS